MFAGSAAMLGKSCRQRPCSTVSRPRLTTDHPPRLTLKADPPETLTAGTKPSNPRDLRRAAVRENPGVLPTRICLTNGATLGEIPWSHWPSGLRRPHIMPAKSRFARLRQAGWSCDTSTVTSVTDTSYNASTILSAPVQAGDRSPYRSFQAGERQGFCWALKIMCIDSFGTWAYNKDSENDRSPTVPNRAVARATRTTGEKGCIRAINSMSPNFSFVWSGAAWSRLRQRFIRCTGRFTLKCTGVRLGGKAKLAKPCRQGEN